MKIRWGIIGCGGIARRRTIPGLVGAENAELVAVMDTNETFAKEVAEEFGVAHAFSDMDSLLALDEVDAVYIATPVFCHKEQVIAAANAGKHILLEKPMALTSREAEELKELCDAKGVRLSIGLMMRFHAYHEEIRRLISEGAIGDIVSIRSQFACWYPDIPGVWRQDKSKSGGGALVDLGVHCIDLVQYVTGLRCIEVAAFCDTQTFSYGVDDSASVLLRMNNGALCVIESNFNIPDDAVTGKIEIYGTAGSIRADGTLAQEEVGTVQILRSDAAKGYDAAQTRAGNSATCIDVPTGNMYTKEVERFGDAIINGTPSPVPAEDAIFVQKIVEAAYISEAEKRFVAV
ncbi:MAG: Gfo/Idh/MocA family oxidoreductase [Clostridia bacterium]|nr:Gfo/Idh/MocA family oxidoreductase [Oscillospiraceae bacterium]MBQ7034070.1 Gfo/Idh/MocA family oxidoreductase [Clostridia bacterium]